jgi:hypothetical protein
MRVKA